MVQFDEEMFPLTYSTANLGFRLKVQNECEYAHNILIRIEKFAIPIKPFKIMPSFPTLSTHVSLKQLKHT